MAELSKRDTRKLTRYIKRQEKLNKRTKDAYKITEEVLPPSTITGGEETGGIVTGGSTDVITISKERKPSSGGSKQVLVMPSSTSQTPIFTITKDTAPLVNRNEVAKFRFKRLQEMNQDRIIRPLRPIKTIKNIKNKLLKDREGTIIYDIESGVAGYEKGSGKKTIEESLRELQEKIESSKARDKDKKYLKVLGKEASILGISFLTESLSGIKGFINLPKNVVKTIPKLPKLAVDVVRNRKNIIPMAKTSFKRFKDRQGYLLKTSPSSFLGKVGANIFLFKSSGKALKVVGKLNKPATEKISQYLPKFKSKVKFDGFQIKAKNKVFTFVTFKSGRKIYGFASGISTIGKKGKLILNELKGKAYKTKSFAYLRKQPLDKKKVISFLSSDIGYGKAIKKLKIDSLKGLGWIGTKNGAIKLINLNKGVSVNKAITHYIQRNIGTSLQVKGKKWFDIVKNGKVLKIKSKPLTLRTFISQSKIFTNKDLSLILGKAKTNFKEIVQYKGRIRTFNLKDGLGLSINKGGKTITQKLTKQNLVNIASALSVGQIGAKKILTKLSPELKKFINNNIKAGLVLIPKLDKKEGIIPSVSAQSLTTSLSGLESQSSTGSSEQLGSNTRKIETHVDYFQPIISIASGSSSRSILKSKSVPKQQDKIIEVLKSPSAQKNIQKLTPRQRERLKQYLRSYLKVYPSMRVPLIRIIPFGFYLKSKSKIKRSKDYRNLKTGWVVYGYSNGAYRRLNSKPLSKIDALSRGAYAIDRTTAKTFKIVPVPKVLNYGRLNKREKGYFTKTKPKFREFKIKKGTKYFLQYKLIEKRKYGIDTSGEKIGLSLYKYLAKLKREGKY